MRRAYKLRAYPTRPQQSRAVRLLAEPVPLAATGRSVAKAESAGRRVVLVNPTHTSIDCHACGASYARPRQDTVICPVHGELDADLNGARNIATRAGLGSGQVLAA